MNESKKLTRFIKNGDISSFEELFRFYYPRLRKYAFHFLQNEEEVNDLVQDVFLQLWSKRKTLDEEKNGVAFLFILLKNKCLNSLKKKMIEGKYIQRQSYLETERLYHISLTQQQEFEPMADRLKNDIEKVIDNMPERCSIAFRLKWLEGKKIKEIAEIMNISITMVDKHLARGMEIARKTIKPELLLLYLFVK